MKNKLKVGLAFLIALAFILPSGAIIADKSLSGSEEAVENFEPNDNSVAPMNLNIFTQQGPCIVGYNGVYLKNPDGEITELDMDDTVPIEDYYSILVDMYAIGQPCPDEALVKPLLELYCHSAGEEVLMYETSFEDNFDIYNNWVQIDDDCAYGGYYDSFSWSDARSSDGDHSMKSTMYDIYKGNQDDYLLCLKSFDTSDQDGLEVTFDIWVDGQGDGYEDFFDYLSFEVGDDTGLWLPTDTWTLDGAVPYEFWSTDLALFDYGVAIGMEDDDDEYYVEEIGSGWWKVHWYGSTADLAGEGLNIEDIMFRFDWHTDPQQQYEGAYVDNFKVISIEDMNTKVFQTHSQGCIPISGEGSFFEFPLDWEGVDDCECYTMVLWLQVCDDIYESENEWDNPLVRDFCVGDNFDCIIHDMFIEDSFTGEVVTEDDFMYEGHDAHIVFDYLQGGNVPGVDIPVKATARKAEWTVPYEEGFEGMIWSDRDAPWHKTDVDAYSGSYSLGGFDQDTMHYTNDLYYDWVMAPKSINMENLEECYVDFTYKLITAGVADTVQIVFIDTGTNYVMREGFVGPNSGYHPDWIGPENPRGVYQSFDMLTAWEDEIADGYFVNSDGSTNYDVQIGFAFFTDSEGYVNTQAEENGEYWSGIFIDDFKVRSKVCGEEVWSETMILPGPFLPGEGTTAQFEWEDVPYSQYCIKVETLCEGDVNEDNNYKESTILVLDDLEMMTDKLVETVDYTGESSCEWGICTSDYDNYMSTNPTTEYYQANCNAIATLAPDYENCDLDGDACIDISHLDIHDPAPVVTQYIDEEFDGPALPVSWTQTGAEFIWGAGNQAGGDSAGQCSVNAGSIIVPGSDIRTPLFDASGDDSVTLDFTWAADHGATPGAFDVTVYAYDTAIPGWTIIYDQAVTADVTATDVSMSLTTTTTQLSFEVRNVAAGELTWFTFDDVLVEGTYQAYAPDNLDFEFDAWWELSAPDKVILEIVDGCPGDLYGDWDEVKSWDGFSGNELLADDDNWVHEVIDLEPFVLNNSFNLRFRFVSNDDGTELRGFIIDDAHIDNLFDVTDITDPTPVFEDFDDPFDDMSNWCAGTFSYGDYWNNWCINIPALEIDNAMIWETEINDAYEAYLFINHTWNMQDIIHYYKNDIESTADFAEFTAFDYAGGTNCYGNSPIWQYSPVGGMANLDVAGVYWYYGFYLGPGVTEVVCGQPFDAELRTPSFDASTLPGLTNDIIIDFSTNVNPDEGPLDTAEVILYDGGSPSLLKTYGAYYNGRDQIIIDQTTLNNPANLEIGWAFDTNGASYDAAGHCIGPFGAWSWDNLYWLDVRAESPTVWGFIEVSTDGGENWYVLDEITGAGSEVARYDISHLTGNDLLVRFRAVGNGGSVGDWCIHDAYIRGKKDTDAPSSSITMSGTMTDAGWYSSTVQCTITAVDVGSGMGEIHYILDGSETVVSGDTATFTVSGNGAHNLEFWAVDNTGNVETPHNTVPTFRIDSGSPPTVAITQPEPGLYLFGNKLLSSSKVFIIGAFTVEATASDAESGVYKVQFLLDGDVVSEDTEVPYSAYVAVKHMGAGTIKVVAEDFSGNTAEDTLDITYYKFL